MSIKNFQIIKQIDLDIKRNLVIIGGANGQGKTSVLRAIHACIVGKSALKDKDNPVRDGEKESEVILSLCDIEIVRKVDTNDRWQVLFRRNGRVETSKVQDRLDTLVSRMTFDPSFLWDSKVTEKDRVKLFLDAIGVDISDLEAKRQDAYDRRRDLGRDITRLKGWLDQNPLEMDAPDEEVDVEALSKELQEGHKTNRAKENTLTEVERNHEKYLDLKLKLAGIRAKIKELQDQEKYILETGKALKAEMETLETRAQNMPEIDTETIAEALRNATDTNRKYRDAQERKATGEELAKAEAEHAAQEKAIGLCDTEKQQRLKTAKLPLPGLTATEEGLYLDGHPISRACGRDRLTLGICVAAAKADPDLPLVCCDGGEQFDAAWLPHIEDLAEQYGIVVVLTTSSTGHNALCTIIMQGGQAMSLQAYEQMTAGLEIEDAPSVLVPTNAPSEEEVAGAFSDVIAAAASGELTDEEMDELQMDDDKDPAYEFMIEARLQEITMEEEL